MLRRSLFDLCGIGILYRIVIASLLLLLLGAGDCYGQALSVTAVATSASCGQKNGTITPTGAGGTPPYDYSIDFGANWYPAPYTFINLAAGPQTIFVRDVNRINNSFTTVTVNQGCITLNTTIQSATCGNRNGSLTINQTGGVGTINYSIDGGTTFQTSNSFRNIPGGMYNIYVEDAQNTVATLSQIVGGLPGATVNPTAQPASCVNNDGSVVVTAIGGLPPFAYKIDNGSYGSVNSFSGVSSGPHTMWVQDGNSCETSAAVTVPLNNSLVLTMGSDPTICEGKSTKLPASSPNGVSFAWSPATGLSNATVVAPVANPTTTTTYTLTATWGACTQTGVVTVTVNPAPIADAGAPVTTCYGKSVQLQGSGASSFRWRPITFLDNPAIADPTVVQPTATTTYHLQVTDGNQCTSLNDASVTVTVPPPSQLFAGNDTDVVAGQPVPLHAVDVSNSGFRQYQWVPAVGLSNAFIQDPVAVVGQSTTYIVTGTTGGGCLGVDTVTINVFSVADIYVPNAFSPNHDGHNDLLRVTASSIRELRSFTVYDRWGAQVFSTTNPATGWDGTRNGKESPPGVYVWMAVGVDYQGRMVQRKGTVMLIR